MTSRSRGPARRDTAGWHPGARPRVISDNGPQFIAGDFHFRISVDAFVDALKLIAATGTCLLAPREPGDRVRLTLR